jgi:WD40 repeat protein
MLVAGRKPKSTPVHEFLIWEVTSGKILRSLRVSTEQGFHKGRSYLGAFSPDGRRLAVACVDGAVTLLDLALGKEIRRLGDEVELAPLAFSPDGKMLAWAAWGGKGGIALVDAVTGNPVRTLLNRSKYVGALNFSADGKRLVCGTEGGISVCDVKTGKEWSPGEGHRGAVRSLACSPDGRTIASSGTDGTVRLWQTATGKELRRVETRSEGGGCQLVFAPNGRSLACADPCLGGRVKIIEIVNSKLRDVWRPYSGGQLIGYRVAIAPDGKTIATLRRRDDGESAQTILQLWDATRKVIQKFPDNRSAYSITDFEFSPNGKTIITLDKDRVVRRSDVATGRELSSMHASCLEHAWSIALAPHGSRAVGTFIEGIRIFDTNRRHQAVEIREAGCALAPLAFSPDGRRLAVACYGERVRLFETAAGNSCGYATSQWHSPRRSYSSGECTALVFSPDSRRLVSGWEDGTILVWDLSQISASEHKKKGMSTMLQRE